MDNLAMASASKRRRVYFIISCTALLFLGSASAGPAGFSRSTPQSCAPICTPGNGPTKFQYDPGTVYEYEFSSELETLVLEETTDKSRLKLTSLLELQIISSCDFSVQLKDVSLQDGINSNVVKNALEKNSIRFSFQDGSIDHICSHPDEPGWVLNVKRGIVSMFQNTMEDWNFEGVVSETDINGKCVTQYGQSTPAWGGSSSVTKTKDLSTCLNRRHHFSSIQSVPYATIPESSLLSGRVECTQTLLQGKIERVECLEEQVFKPFQENNSGARNVISQRVRLITTRPAGTPPQDLGPRRRSSSLVFEMDTSSTEIDKDSSKAVNILLELEAKTVPNIQTEAPFLFRELVTALRGLDEGSIRSILTRVRGGGMENSFLSGLALVNTAPSVTILTELYLGGGLSSDLAESWLSGVTFVKYPTPQMIDALMPLLRTKPDMKVLLSVSGVMHSFCKNKLVDCSSNGVIQEGIQLIARPLQDSVCNFPEDSPQTWNAVVALKALGNLGIFPGNQLLEKCFLSKKNGITIRLAAMEAHRRMPCSSFSTLPFLQVYGDYEEDTEARIQAYLVAMKCANRNVLETVEDILTGEVVNQVGSFVWTHLTNLQETNRPDKVTIRNLVSNDVLRNKFQTDARKFSRNYETSLFSDDYKIGGGLDASVIFTEGSFLPKSAMANLSLHLFGETVNFLEFGGRFNSPESLLEPIFGPQGYFPDESMSSFLKSTRQKRDTSSKLGRLSVLHDTAAERIDDSPGGSFYTRFFGHEVLYKEYEVNTESSIPNLVDEGGKKWFNIKNILDNLSTGKKLGFTRSNILMDVDYSVPTMAGIPLTLTLELGSTVGLTSEGRFNVGKFIERKEVEVYGLLRPNLAVNMEASLTLGLGPGNKGIRSGLSVRNVLRSSTAFETRVEINGWNGLKAVVNLPQSRQEVLEVSSKVVFLQSGGVERVLESEAGGPRIELESCFGNGGSNFLGLKVCGEIKAPKQFTGTPMTPSVLRLYLEKTDEFSGYAVDYSLERGATKTLLNLVYDTTGSRIDRRSSLNFVRNAGGSFQATVKTPGNLLDARGTYSGALKQLDVTLISSNETLLQLNTSLVAAGNGISSKFYLEMFQKPVAELKGSIQLPSGDKKGNVDITLKHVTENPIRLQGNYVGREDGSEINLGLESYYFTGNLRSSIKTRVNHWSSRSMLEYSWKHGPLATMDISAKLQKTLKGALSKTSASASFITSTYPDHNLEFSWETQTSPGFCENVAKFVIGKSSWDAHTLYSFQNTRDLTELRFLLSLNNVRDEVDYLLEFAHRLEDRSINTKFLGRVSPGQEVMAKFHYDSISKPFLANNLTASVTWPGAGYSASAALIEKRKGEFDGEIQININSQKEMKATISYINNSNNLKLDHLIEFRARGFIFAPISGNVGFTVTDKQSHIGCQVIIEGRKPYSSRLSTSIDYSHVRNVHKIEAKVTLNERKYSGEVLFGQTKNGSKHLTLDLFLNQHIFLEAKMAGNYMTGISGSVLVVPRKGEAPLEKLEAVGTLSPNMVGLGLNYFGDQYNLTGGVGEESANLEVGWGQKKITTFVQMSSISSGVGMASLEVTTPFSELRNVSLRWNHEVGPESLSGRLVGGFGRKKLLISLSAGMSPTEGKVSGVWDVSGYSRCELDVQGEKSGSVDSVAASFSRGETKTSFQMLYKHAHNVSAVSVGLKGIKSWPEISALWDSQQDGKHSKLQLDWVSNPSKNKSSLHFELEKTQNPTSYQISLVSPLPIWKSSSGRLLLDHVSSSYSFDMRNNAKISILPKKLSLALGGTVATGFNHSAAILFSHTQYDWSLSGHIRGLGDTQLSAEIKSPLHSYSGNVRSQSENGVRVLEVVTDFDSQKSELGLLLKNGVSQEKNEITAWGTYLSGREKRATLSFQRESQLRKVNLEVREDSSSLLELESDFVWTGFQFWSVTCQLRSNLGGVPSLSLESSQNMLNINAILNSNSFAIVPHPGSFWDGRSWVQNVSSHVAITNLERLYSSLAWDGDEVVVAGERSGNQVGFVVSSTVFEPISGNISYAVEADKVELKAVVFSSGEVVVDAILKAARSPVGRGSKRVTVDGVWKAKYLPKIESKFLLDQGAGVIETFLVSDKKYVFHLNLEGEARGNQGLLKFKSQSAFYPSINEFGLDTSYKFGDQGDVQVEAKVIKGTLIQGVQGTGGWAQDKQWVRVVSSGEFVGELEISLENFNNLQAVATYNGRRLGAVRALYEPKHSTYAWGSHNIFLEFIAGGGSSHNASISFSADPRKVDVSVTTPLVGWSTSRLYWDVDAGTTGKLGRFGVHKDGNKLDAVFDLKFQRKNETTIVHSEIRILGFKSLRRLLFLGDEDEVESERQRYLTQLSAVEGTFSALAKWSLTSVQVAFKTPLERWRDLKFAGKYDNKRTGLNFEVSCDINEKHHELKGVFKLGQTSLDLDFSVKCLQAYKGKLGVVYASDYRLDFDIQAPNKLGWKVNGGWDKEAIILAVSTPIKNWELVHLEARHVFNSSEQHEGSLYWEINKDRKLLGYNYLRQENNLSLNFLTPIQNWEQVNMTLTSDWFLNQINFKAERSDGQRIVVDVSKKVIGILSNLSSDGSLSLQVHVESPFQAYRAMALTTQYDRVGGEHKASIEYIRNQELVKLAGHFTYNQRSPHAVQLTLDLSSFPNVSSKVEATLSVDPLGNSSFTAVVVYNEARHEVTAALDLSGGDVTLVLGTTLEFLRSVRLSFQHREKLVLHGSWEGSGQILDVKSVLVGSGLRQQRLNLSVVSPFPGVRHVFFYGDFKLGSESVRGYFLFENEKSRWLGKVEGDGVREWDGKWKAALNTPEGDVLVKLEHGWGQLLKGLTCSVEGNAVKWVDLGVSHKSGGEILVGLEVLGVTPVSTHLSLNLGQGMVETTVRVGEEDDRMMLEVSIQGLSAGVAHFRGGQSSLSQLSSRLAWKLDGNLEQGNGWASLSNEVLGTRSVRLDWKAGSWKNIRIGSWLRFNETGEEIGGMGHFTMTPSAGEGTKIVLVGNWDLAQDGEGQSLTVIVKFGQYRKRESSHVSYFGEIDAQSTIAMFRSLSASTNLTMFPELALKLEVTRDDAHWLSLDSNLTLSPTRSGISLQLNAPKVISGPKFDFSAEYDITPERKSLEIRYDQENNGISLGIMLTTPKSRNASEFVFILVSNFSSVQLRAEGSLKTSPENGLSQLNLVLESEPLGNWNFFGEIRPSLSDFTCSIHLNNTEGIGSHLLTANWRGNWLQGVTGSISLVKGEVQVKGNLSLEHDSVRVSLSTPFFWAKNLELVGHLGAETTPKHFTATLRTNGESFRVVGNYNMSTSWEGGGSIGVTKGDEDESLGLLELGVDTVGNYEVTGSWRGEEVQVKGRIWLGSTKTGWLEDGRLDVVLFLGGVEKLNLQSAHKLRGDECYWNVTSRDGRKAAEIRVTSVPNYAVYTNLYWDENTRLKCSLDVKQNGVEMSFSSPWTKEITARAQFENHPSRTMIEGLILVDSQASWARLQTNAGNDSVQFNISLEVPALHQKLLTTLLIKSRNPHQSGGEIAINLNGHQFGVSGELSSSRNRDSFQKQSQLSLSLLPIKNMKKLGLKIVLRQGPQNMGLNATLSLGEDTSLLVFGYDTPSRQDGRLGFIFMLDNHILSSFKYGASFGMDNSLKNVEGSVNLNSNCVEISWGLNFPEVKASLKLSLEEDILNHYQFEGVGFIDPSRILNTSLTATFREKSWELDFLTELESKGFLCQAGLRSSYLPNFDHRLHLQIRNLNPASYQVELSVDGVARLELSGDLLINAEGGLASNGKLTGDFGSLYGRLDYSKESSVGHEVRLSLESPSLITGKKVVIRGNVVPKKNGLDASITCRTRSSVHGINIGVEVEKETGKIDLVLSSPSWQPLNLQVSWKRDGDKFAGGVKAHLNGVVNELETFLDIQKLEGRVKILSPLIPSSHFEVHLKSLFSLDEIDILGDVHIREYHWRFEGGLKYQNWRDTVIMFHLLTPQASFDRLTFALKSLDDEIYVEIYTPIVSLPKAMLTLRGFRAFQEGRWHDLRPQVSVGLPFGRYSFSGVYMTPNSTTPGKFQLHFEDGLRQETYEIRAELSPLALFSFDMTDNARISLYLHTPLEILSNLDFGLEGRVRGRNLIHILTTGKLDNDSVSFWFDYNDDNGSPSLNAKLSSPFQMYENVGLALSFDTFQKIGVGRSLHMVLQNDEWMSDITLNADYRYTYTSFLTMDGELNAVLDSFMDIPSLHLSLITGTEEGFSGGLVAQLGTTPASLKIDVGLGQDNEGTLLINGTVGGEEELYTALIKSHLHREEELVAFSTQISLSDEDLLVTHLSFSTELDGMGADFYGATPWGPIQFRGSLVPISALFSENNFEIGKLFRDSNATLDLTFDSERLIGLQLVSRDGVAVIELFNPIAPVSLILSLKTVTKSSVQVLGQFCWNLDSPVGNTVGIGMDWDASLLGRRAQLALQMEQVGNLEVALFHSLTSSVLNQSLALEWNSPIFKTVGRSGYHVLLSKGSLLKYTKYDSFLRIDSPWRSLVLEGSSNNNPGEYLSSLGLKWDADRDESKFVGVRWQEEVKMGWKGMEISDFLEISHPLSPLPVTVSSERIYRNGRFQLVEFEMNGSDLPQNAWIVSIFRNNTSWTNSRSRLSHRASNTSMSLNVRTEDDYFSSEVSYMGWDASVRNLTLDLISKEDIFQLVLFTVTPNKNTDILIFKNVVFQNLNTLNIRFLSYDADLLFQSSLPFLEVMVKHRGEDKLNVFGGYSHKKKVGAHITKITGETSTHFFQAMAELTPTNALTSRVVWLPDLFSNLLNLQIPGEISSSIFTDIDSLGFLQGLETELGVRWNNQVSPEVRSGLLEVKNFLEKEFKLIWEECVGLTSKIMGLYDNNVFYIRDILSNFQFLFRWKENLGILLEEVQTAFQEAASTILSATSELYQNSGGRLEHLVMDAWKEAEDFLESTWVENVAWTSSVFNRLWDIAKIVLDVLEGKIEQLENKLMAVGFFRRLVQLHNLYKDYATWLEEVPFTEFTRKIEAMMNVRIWDRLKLYLEPLLTTIRSGVEDQYFLDLLETPPLPFLRYGLANLGRAVGKFWEVLEIEQRLKSIVRAGLSSLDRVLHRYLPTAYWSYDLDQGFVQYNQSLSAIQWVDFTTQPRWRTAAEEVHDVSQLTNFYYQALDTIESLKPVFNLNIRTILPPFGSYALMAGDYHYFTYDKKYFRFAGECSYLLVGDLSTAADAFSLLVNYENRNGVIRKGSYSITANSSLVDIDVTDFKVSINGRKIELPLQLGTLFIRRHQTGLEVYDSRGFTMTCSLSYSVCTVGVSGWHFGKVAGILGTYDNEPSNDFQSPDGSQIRDVSAFAYSWRVGGNSGSCRMKNYAKDETELVDSDGICGDLLQKRSSPLRPCFNTVDTQVFLEMCVYDVSKNVNSAHRAEAACFAMNAYVTECQKNKVDVWMPPNCVRCRLEDGSALTTGENATLQSNGERPPPSSSDNVILLQESSCISSTIVSEAIKRLDAALVGEGLLNNKYAVVGYGGNLAHEQPHVKTISGNVWAHNTLFRGIPNDTAPEEGSRSRVNLYDAILYAATLGFRAGVAKNFIAVTCGEEDCGDSVRYSDVLTLLVENDIKLHMLVPKEFTLKGNRKDEVNPIYGMDMNGVYTLKQGKNGVLDPDPVLKRQINIPKDLCTPLALESNGTRFNLGSGSKMVLDVWSRRVAQTSHPSTCQQCDCVPDRFGSSSIMCHQCVSPSLWKFMEEWKSYQGLDGEEFPVDLLEHDFIMA